ncbi:MAG TPA: cohesin domain-containing protein [Anaerolineae bacterium]|nr:cohesin domain-containing protein [Anaerolineae bacterium]
MVNRTRLLVALMVMPVIAAAPPLTPATIVRLDPPASEVRAGHLVRLSVRVEDVADLNCVDVQLTYDPAALEPQDAIPLTFGTQIAPGPFLHADQMMANSAEDGAIHYRVAQLWPNPPVSGSGVIASITFKALRAGSTSVAFESSASSLCDANGAPLAVSEWNGAQILVRPDVTLSGLFQRQGWPIYNRTSVWTVLMGGADQYPVANRTICTESDGRFRLAIPDDFTSALSQPVQPQAFAPVSCPAPGISPYRSAYVRASFPNHLSAQGWVCLSDGAMDLGTVTLPAGDVNGDEAINISDLVLIGANFGRAVQPPCAVPVGGCPSSFRAAPRGDINGDCRVNVQDAAVLIASFGRTGPLPLGALSTLLPAPN